MVEPVEAHELHFVAPVPRDHDVLLLTLQPYGARLPAIACVLDETAGILYCGEPLYDTFCREQISLIDPAAIFAKFGQPIERITRGRVVGSIVSTRNDGDANHARTRIFLHPTTATAPYR